MQSPLDQYDQTFEAAGQEWGVDPRLLKAIATQESGGRTDAVSPKGAQGLMQITPGTQKYLGMTDPNDPVQSIYGAAKYLSEGLDKEGSPEGALLFYHGGENWRQAYGPESAAYVPAVTKHYQQLGQVKTALAAPDPSTATDAASASTPAPAVSTGAGKAMANDDPLSLLPPAPKPSAGGPATASPDDPLSLLPPAPKPAGTTATTQAAQPGGLVKNIAAGELEGVGGTINALTNPSGNLVGKPLATAIVFAHDALAPVFGYERFPDDVRNALLNDTVPQPGTQIIEGIGGAIGAKPSDVPAPTPAEQYARTAAAGATMGAMAGPAVIVPGAVGAVAGKAAGAAVPPWAAPATELATNALAAAATMPVQAGVKAGVNALSGAVSRFADAPGVAEPNRALAAGGSTTAPTSPASAVSAPAAPAEGGGPQPGMGAAQPSGAQVTPSAAAQMTPEEIATQRTVADKQWLNQTQQPGVRDTTQHIPGITPNLVEQEQTVTAARELKALKNLNPELSQAEREILDRNTELRKGFYADTVGSDVTRAADLKAANDKINTDLANVWQGKGEADPANVHTQIQTELAGSAGDLPPVKSAMKQVSDSLENAGTDPQAMYRTHRLINYLQSKQGQLANPGYGAGDVQAALTRVKATLASTIDDAAPGFGNAMSDYAGARGPIDAAKALQDRENGLYDSRGHMSFLKVHALMRDIIDAQKWDAPNDPLAGVSDAQMTRLKALHDDLKKVASAKDLAAAQGSDTAMNAVDIAKAYGKLAGRAGIEGAANVAFGPGVGSMVVRGAENLLRPITSGIAARQQMRRGMEILQPKPNPLQPPPSTP